MNFNLVRISNIEIKNFKNVGFGRINLENSADERSASILGLYGQNGSGKTALIDAIELLQRALSGRDVPSYFADYINVESETAEIKYGFNVLNHDTNAVYSVEYKVTLGRVNNTSENNIEHQYVYDSYKAVLFNEVLSYSYECGNDKRRFAPMIDTSTKKDVVFAPATKYKTLIGNNKETLTSLLAAKQLAYTSSRSFIFSRELLEVVRNNDDLKTKSISNPKEDNPGWLLENLVFFGNYQLFFINTTTSGLINMNVLPLAFNYKRNGIFATGGIMIKLNEPSVIPKKEFDVVCNVIDSMNIVLKQIVPGLTIGVKELGEQLLKNGDVAIRIQLVSKKNSREISLLYESNGIKKLVSILCLLIAIYNNSSITVAVDELDAGVFEYLLGELLRIIAEKGCGQLIFTSHNLRPLETINKRFIAFTTTNPQNRYMAINHVKTTKNLRDFYFRDIIVNEQKEQLYDPTNNTLIALSFLEAGQQNGEK